MAKVPLPDYREFVAPDEPRESLLWRINIIRKCKWYSNNIWRFWYRIYRKRGYREANLWLLSIQERLKLGKTGLSIDADDFEIDSYANAKSRSIGIDIVDFGSRFHRVAAIEAIQKRFSSTGLKIPVDPKHYKETFDVDKVVTGLAKIKDEFWLRKQLKNKATRELEQIARELGQVKKGSSPYISDFTLRRILSRKKANRKLLEKLFATNETGQQFSLAELSDKSVSNPVLRRLELMTRLDGMEKWAMNDARPWRAIVYTLTTPSKYHPLKIAASGKVISNPKYNRSTPKDAQQYLMKVWAKIRATLGNKSVEYFGFRVAEPHHDGTPHWHILLYAQEHQEAMLTDTIKQYALEEDGDERGADKHRFQALRINTELGRATGYLAKYISKNIDGYNLERDEEGGLLAPASAIRVACWASAWGIRQFSALGEPPVTVWRELRKLSSEELLSQLAETCDPSNITAIHQAADEGDFEQYIHLMGGAIAPRKSLPLRAFYFLKSEVSKYGEEVRKLTGLITTTGREINTRLRTWTIGLKRIPVALLSGDTHRTGPPCGPLEFCQ